MKNYIAQKYVPTKTLQDFHWDDSFVRGILGPFGSGKSVAMCMEILRRAKEMRVDDEETKIRRSKWAIVRATYPELMGSTLETWKKILPEEHLHFKLGNREVPSCSIKMQLDDGSIMDLRMEFFALDNPQNVDKLASFEYTAAWLNEAREIPYEVLSHVTGRVGRFPLKTYAENGEEIPFWSGIIMDTNAPDDDHWWYRLAEVERPNSYRFFKQPPALIKNEKTGEYIGNPDAENIKNIPGGYQYYFNMIPGKNEAWIKVYIQSQYGTLSLGKQVYPSFDETIHISTKKLDLIGGLPIIAGVDYGINSAVVFAQLSKFGQLRVVGEIFVDNITTREFIQDYVKPYVINHFNGMRIEWYGDPAGMTRSNVDGRTCTQEYLSFGINIQPCATNSPEARIQAVTTFLNKRDGFIISANCHNLIKGFRGEYCYERLRTSQERFSVSPTKNKYSHAHDALQYLALSLDRNFGNHMRRSVKIKKAPTRWSA